VPQIAICFSIGSRAYDAQHLGIFNGRTSDCRSAHASTEGGRQWLVGIVLAYSSQYATVVKPSPASHPGSSFRRPTEPNPVDLGSKTELMTTVHVNGIRA